jgi:hypothetical protein
MRIFPGNITQASAEPAEPSFAEAADAQPETAAETVDELWVPPPASDSSSEEVVDGNVLQERDIPAIVDAEEAPPIAAAAEKRQRRGGSRGNRARGETRARKSGEGANSTAPRARKTAAKPRQPRARQRTDATTE